MHQSICFDDSAIVFRVSGLHRCPALFVVIFISELNFAVCPDVIGLCDNFLIGVVLCVCALSDLFRNHLSICLVLRTILCRVSISNGVKLLQTSCFVTLLDAVPKLIEARVLNFSQFTRQRCCKS